MIEGFINEFLFAIIAYIQALLSATNLFSAHS